MVTELSQPQLDDSQEMQVVSLKDAAKALGIGESAVRKRLAKGQLHGEKDAKGQWIAVMLPVGVTPETAEEEDDREFDSPSAEREITLLREIIELHKQEIAARDRENDYLRQRLANMEVLLGQSLQNTKALLPPEESPKEAERRAWWKFGKK